MFRHILLIGAILMIITGYSILYMPIEVDYGEAAIRAQQGMLLSVIGGIIIMLYIALRR